MRKSNRKRCSQRRGSMGRNVSQLNLGQEAGPGSQPPHRLPEATHPPSLLGLGAEPLSPSSSSSLLAWLEVSAERST